jgi:hypothetical protein
VSHRLGAPGDSVFTLTDPDRYESVSRYHIGPTFRELLTGVLPNDWIVQREGIWLHCSPKEIRSEPEYSTQGFKIHVSAVPSAALKLLAIVAAYSAQKRLPFKTTADTVIYAMQNSKTFPRGNSGKFITIYPPNLQQFRHALADLYELTKDPTLTGPYILSDRRYRDSSVLFYRYGGFRPVRQLRADGTTSLQIVAPDGTLVDDERLPYYQLPPWVPEPFVDAAADAPSDPTVKLAQRYSVLGAIYYSNSGGVYTGIDESTGATVIIKEARPGTNLWQVGDTIRDAPFFLRREYHTLLKLRGLPGIPAALDLFDEWEHRFLVETMVNGVTLESYFAQEDRIIAPYIHRQGRLPGFIQCFAHVGRTLVSLIAAVHENGIILGDLSPRNIMINPADLSISLIDFESAVATEGESHLRGHAMAWATAGFLNPERLLEDRQPAPQDDFFALGRVLLSILVPVNQLLSLKPEGEHAFISAMVRHGLPVEVPRILLSLQAGDWESASGELASLAHDD